MVRLFFKIISIFAIIGFTYLYANDGNIASLISIIASVGTCIGNDYVPDGKKLSEFDTGLIHRLIKELPSTCRGIQFLKNDGIGPSYSSNDVEELDRFLHEWDNPDHEFTHRGLKRKKDGFITALRDYLTQLGACSSSHPFSDTGYTLKRGDHDYKKENEERDSLSELVDIAYKKYASLIRYAKKKI